jgi:hypothetical protein
VIIRARRQTRRIRLPQFDLSASAQGALHESEARVQTMIDRVTPPNDWFRGIDDLGHVLW